MAQLGVDDKFLTLPKNSTFFIIWRIEKFKLVQVPKENLGTFYSGDSYVVVCAEDGEERVTCLSERRRVKPGFPTEIHIHFWLGSKTSKDESVVAVRKTVELDDFYSGRAIQHREPQGKESTRFINYFPNGITILEGGVDSGLNHVSSQTQTRLYHVKGRRAPVVIEKSVIAWSSLNSDDVFVLNTTNHVFLWIGKEANKMEKVQGAKVGQNLRTEEGRRCKEYVVVEDGNESAMSVSERKVFEAYFPLADKEANIGKTLDYNDNQVEQRQHSTLVLYQCCDEEGQLVVTEVKRGVLLQNDLKSKDTFIVDNGENGIWVWIGKHATPEERSGGMRVAQEFASKKHNSENIRITRVVDGGETIQFKSLFRNWTDKEDLSLTGNKMPVLRSNFNKNHRASFDVKELHRNRKVAANVQMIDDASGAKTVYRVSNYQLIAVPETKVGFFYKNTCYVVVYEQEPNFLIYYWIGSESSATDQGTAALHTIQIDDSKFAGSAVQIRVSEGKEPPHFTAIFGGDLIICKRGFQPDDRSLRMLHVRGNNAYVTRAYEVEATAKSLNSNDVFLVLVPNQLFLWVGKGSEKGEIEMAKRVAKRVSNLKPVHVEEGLEVEEFWSILGGQSEYASDPTLQDSALSGVPRLFHCSNAKGYFAVEEVMDFQQEDLIESDVMILDAIHTIFVWIGNESNQEERQLAVKTAEEYLKVDPRGRENDTVITVVKQGHEPITFTGFFGVWNSSLWKSSQIETDDRVNIQDICPLFDTCKKYSLEKLVVKEVSQLPLGVNPTMKERYLTAEDFVKTFKMSFEKFESLPNWRKILLKKEAQLF